MKMTTGGEIAAPSAKRSTALRQMAGTPIYGRVQLERAEQRGMLQTKTPVRPHPQATACTGLHPPRLPAPHSTPPASMSLLAATLLLLLLALCTLRVEGSKCKCSWKGPKIRYSEVKKLEMKPEYPHCEEKMVIITTKSMSRYRGQEHCLHPKLQSTKCFIKWYNAWNEKRRYNAWNEKRRAYEE